MANFLLIAETVLIVSVLLSIVYVVGIVWRVEAELDISYKFFAFAIVFFLVAELIGVYYSGDDIRFMIAEKSSKALFALLFLGGTLFMRDIVRKLDGEKPKKKK